MRFSQRKGIIPVTQAIQRDGMSQDLRNSLWNVLDLLLWRKPYFLEGRYSQEPAFDEFSMLLWFSFFKKPIDQRPSTPYKALEYIRKYFFAAEWYEVYDFLEWTLNQRDDEDLTTGINTVLASEISGYRFVGETFTEITDPQEIALLESALADDRFEGVQSHLSSALRLLSNRENPDYRNSIKESISAVESMAQVVTGRPKATLGEALTHLEKEKRLHKALKEGFTKLYGYTSDEGGIRHAMLEEPQLSAADAKFFLLSCTSFTNYLKSLI